MTDGAVAAARAYYRSLDDHDYGALADLLAPEFVHERPDMTLEGSDRFVAFMREERPQTDTAHRVDAVYPVRESDAAGERTAAGEGAADSREVAVRGRLLDADGDRIAGFVDVFTVADGRLVRVDTFTR